LFIFTQKTEEAAEVAFIDYAKSVGKLILLHHSISSGKRQNKFWFPFLGIQLPTGDIQHGGYKWYESVELGLVNLAGHHYVTTHKIHFDQEIGYGSRKLPGFDLPDTEVYLNHVHTSPKHLLLGVMAADPESGKLYTQDTTSWYLRTEKGWVFYFMAGHQARDFEHPIFSQMIVNAFTWSPKE
jgi:trehalose utilization protein